MPIDSALAELPGHTHIRKELEKAFPPLKYLWIRPEEGRPYITTDGIHLTKPEVIAFADRIRAELERAGLKKIGD
jgi:hypothetical protein